MEKASKSGLERRKGVERYVGGRTLKAGERDGAECSGGGGEEEREGWREAAEAGGCSVGWRCSGGFGDRVVRGREPGEGQRWGVGAVCAGVCV
jgi:hypothetical protein